MQSGWEGEIEADVKEECSKFGKIYHISVDRATKGFIYIKFDGINAAKGAIDALNGRFFGGKQVTAQFIMDSVYYAKFPGAAAA